ncbi:MAG: hypothetical protein WBC91_08275 [Phototrophicaceae bacterium]
MNFLGGLWNLMEARRRRRNMETAVVFGIGCGAFLICGIIAVIVGSIMNAVETGAVRSAYGADNAAACQSMPSGRDDKDNMPDADSPRQILLLQANTQRRDAWHSELPAQWQAENEAEVALIGCVEQEEITLETCEYNRTAADGDGSFTVRVELKQYQTTLVLINPETSRRIDSLTVTGSEPDECPDSDDVTVSGDQFGDAVEWDDFASWIETYVFE